ncbi:TIGR03862 family flavoprotein [Paracoccus stylophorae]|uniref:TIGR03862 family flavoprotein n=1 Tax=Paracoccus stylophorae TaxID=659350 RepID=A0ABY7SVB1_9RHOB|nr:TIGR03862 family flavoprotein [Paracoccus stylophorae]WCR10967.1 TIGR03862 family flavoprotein [Paracoccus stylophorae]
MNEVPDALVIGAGPAGLMAAEMLSDASHRVVVAEAMPTPARKFLMAGKSGLNLTRAQPAADFARHFGGGSGGCLPPHPRGYFDAKDGTFGPEAVMAWARGLGIELFTGSTGRVFPVGMKASPLLRAWLARLRANGVDLRTRWRWRGVAGGFEFDTPAGPRILSPRATVLALGGASWPRLGSDAGWVPMLRAAGVSVADFRPANMGFRVRWSPQMARHFGAAVKNTAIVAGSATGRGEWIVSRAGIEGGGIYEVAAAIRDGAAAQIDLAPDLDVRALTRRLEAVPDRLSVGNRLRRVLRDPVKVALLLEWGRPWPDTAAGWAARMKALPMRHDGPMGLERAISSAGGIEWSAVMPDLELRALPGVFAAGEMLDWEAPTGGYLLTACLATGRLAGLAASRHAGRL